MPGAVATRVTDSMSSIEPVQPVTPVKDVVVFPVYAHVPSSPVPVNRPVPAKFVVSATFSVVCVPSICWFSCTVVLVDETIVDLSSGLPVQPLMPSNSVDVLLV